MMSRSSRCRRMGRTWWRRRLWRRPWRRILMEEEGGGRKGRSRLLCALALAETRESEGSVIERVSNNTCGVAVRDPIGGIGWRLLASVL